MKSQSKYYHVFAAIAKITLRDGNVVKEEMEFLKHLSSVLSVSLQEYEEIMDSTYMLEDLQVPITYSRRIESMYTLTKLIVEDPVITDNKQAKWLERMASGTGFNPANVKYIVDKGIALVKKGVSLEDFEDGIRNLNK